MRRGWIFLLVAALGAGCASLGSWYHNEEEFVLEVNGYKRWKEVYYLDGRTDMQWLFICRTISPKHRMAKETDIVVTDRHPLFDCPTGTVLKCRIKREAISSWEAIAARESAKVNIKVLKSRVADLEDKIAALERAPGRNKTSLTEAVAAKDELEEAKSQLLQAELYSRAVVVKTADIVRYEEVRSTATNDTQQAEPSQ